MALQNFAGIGNITDQNASGVVGGDAYGDPGGKIGGIWLGGAVAQVQRTTITGASAKTYTVACTIYGVTESASYVAPASPSPTTASVAEGLASAIQALPTFGSFVNVRFSGANIDTTGPLGVAFSITDSDSDITQTTTTAAAAGSNTEPGVFVVLRPTSSLFPNATFAPVSSLTTGTATLLLTFASGTVYTAAITVNGATYTATTVGATDLATTVGALVTAINNAMPAVTVLAATAGAGEVLLTAEVKGLAFVANVDAHTGAGTITVSATSGLPTDDVSQVFGGFVGWSLKQDVQLDVNDIVYQPGDTVPVKARGTIYLGATVTSPGPIFVDVVTGLPSTTGGAGKLPLPQSLASWVAAAPNGSGLAVARVFANNVIPA